MKTTHRLELLSDSFGSTINVSFQIPFNSFPVKLLQDFINNLEVSKTSDQGSYVGGWLFDHLPFPYLPIIPAILPKYHEDTLYQKRTNTILR